jgi:hypothetical protein
MFSAASGEKIMRLIAIPLIASALLFIPLAMAQEGPEGHTPAQIASYAEPEGHTPAQVASYAEPEGQTPAQIADYAAPEGNSNAQLA